MKHYIPENENERLHQLNDFMTKVMYGEDFFNDEKWLPVRLNLSKWRILNYDFVQLSQLNEDDFIEKEKETIYYIFNAITEIILLRKEEKECARKGDYKAAIHFQNLHQDFLLAFTKSGQKNNLILNFFKLQEQTLILNYFDNYFIQQIVRERLRL